MTTVLMLQIGLNWYNVCGIKGSLMHGQIQEYKYVVHATEEARRQRYHSFVSRQVLRARLRRDSIAEVKTKYPKWLRSDIRLFAHALVTHKYREMLGYNVKDKS